MEITITYGKIPGYRNPKKQSWGFSLSSNVLGYDVYTCPRRSARRIFDKIRTKAEEAGLQVTLVVDPCSGLKDDLSP